MSRRSRIFLGVVAVYIAAVVFLLYRVSLDLDPRYRESAEDALVDTANLLATLLERQAYSGVIQTEEIERTLQQLGTRPLHARIFNVDKTRVDLHVYVTDANGIVLFHRSLFLAAEAEPLLQLPNGDIGFDPARFRRRVLELTAVQGSA